MVEFALGVPILLLLLVGLLEVSRAVFVYTVAAGAAREGARYAIMTTVIDPPPAGSPDPGLPTWMQPCNRGLDVAHSPAVQEYLLNDSQCAGWPNVVAAVASKSVGLPGADTKVRIAYQNPNGGALTYGLEGYNRGVPIVVTVIYDHRPIAANFLGIPAMVQIRSSSTMSAQ
jgi:hypothetical protein